MKKDKIDATAEERAAWRERFVPEPGVSAHPELHAWVKRATPELCANLGATAPDPGERTIAPPWADSFALRREELAKAWDDGMSAVKGATNPWRTKP